MFLLTNNNHGDINMSLDKLLEVAESMGHKGHEVIRGIQKRYIEDIKLGRREEVVALHKLTGIRPEPPLDFMQEQYNILVEKEYFAWINEWEEILGIKPRFSEDFIHAKYALFLENGRPLSVIQLYNVSGVAPRFSYEEVQLGYSKIIHSSWNVEGGLDVSLLQGWYKLTGKRINREIVSEAYCEFLKKGDFTSLENLWKATGLKPKFEETVVQEVYEATKNRDDQLKKWRKLYQVTGVRPKVDVDELQRFYLFKLGHWRSEDNESQVRELSEITGIKPAVSEEDVQKEYSKRMRYNGAYGFGEWSFISWNSVNNLREITDIEPDEEIYKLFVHCFFGEEPGKSSS